jgi:hypothetical protein
MISYNCRSNRLEIITPNADEEDLLRYREGLLSILQEITIENCDPDFKENLKAVYEILDHLKA